MAKMELAAMNLMLGDVSGAAMGLETESKPGSFNYANANTQLAGIAISRALKKGGKGNYNAYLASKLWCPLGNADATLFPDDAGEPRYYAFLEASVRDWARVGELIRNKGLAGDKQLVPATWVDEMIKPSAANPNFGLNVWIGKPWKAERRYSKDWDFGVKHSAAYLADDVYFLDGYGGQRVYVVPSAKLVIARSGETSMTWDDAPLVNIALKGLREE
jgi:CubicO group peptidase (beta-lactamase class C family)